MLSCSDAGWTLCSVLMGTTGTRITFLAEAGSENWRVPVTRPLLSSRSYTEPNSNHVCSHPVDLCIQPAWLAGWQVLWSPEQHVISGSIQPFPLAIVIWIPSLCNSTGSLGESGKWFLSVSGLQRHSPPPRSFHSRLGTRWMWLGKYSSLSPGPKVISWYSSCHKLTRSRLRKMV